MFSHVNCIPQTIFILIPMAAEELVGLYGVLCKKALHVAST
jgi:hypothetical protein